LNDPTPFVAGAGYRWITGALGALLLGAGACALAFSGAADLLRFGGGIVLVVFGANAIRAAWRGERSWLSRIGPLP